MLEHFVRMVRETADEAVAFHSLQSEGQQLLENLTSLSETTQVLLRCGDTGLRLANATLYLDAFGHIVIGWMLLRQALVAAHTLSKAEHSNTERNFYEGKIFACRYFSRYELPNSITRFNICKSLDPTCRDVPTEAFGM